MIRLERDGKVATALLEAEICSHVLRSLDNKCRAYWQASRAQPDDYKVVIFAVPDGEHMRRVKNATNAGPQGSSALFDVCLSTEFAERVEKYLN